MSFRRLQKDAAAIMREVGIKAGLDADPLRFLLTVMVDDKVPWDVRIKCALGARKACHPDLLSTTHTGPDGGPMQFAILQQMALDPAKASLMEQLALAMLAERKRAETNRALLPAAEDAELVPTSETQS